MGTRPPPPGPRRAPPAVATRCSGCAAGLAGWKSALNAATSSSVEAIGWPFLGTPRHRQKSWPTTRFPCDAPRDRASSTPSAGPGRPANTHRQRDGGHHRHHEAAADPARPSCPFRSARRRRWWGRRQVRFVLAGGSPSAASGGSAPPRPGPCGVVMVVAPADGAAGTDPRHQASRAAMPISHGRSPRGSVRCARWGTPHGSSGASRYRRSARRSLSCSSETVSEPNTGICPGPTRTAPATSVGLRAQPGCGPAVAERAPAARRAVTGLAVGPEDLAAGGEVGVVEVDVRDLGTVPQRADERDQRRLLVLVVLGRLADGLLLAVAERHAAGRQVVVGGRLARLLEGGPTHVAVVALDPPALRPVTARAAGLVQLAAGGQKVVVVGLATRRLHDQRGHHRGRHERHGDEQAVEAAARGHGEVIAGGRSLRTWLPTRHRRNASSRHTPRRSRARGLASGRRSRSRWRP